MADLRIVDAPVLLQESITDDVKIPTGGLGNFSIRLGDIVWYVVTKEQLANKNYVDLSSKGVKDKLDEHIADKANPHQVTKVQVGLGNVDNTADIDKPVSNAVSSAIITATNDMATKTYVNGKDGDLTTLTTTDKTSLVKAINEVVSIKANKEDVASSISDLTNNKADKATTLEGYGITDAYTKSVIDADYSGIKAMYVKNVEYGVGTDGWTTELILDTDKNLTQKQINSNQEKLNTVLNKTGTTETLAESVDATPFLQALINAMPDGMTLDLLGKTFRIKKNTGFVSDYPNGDQPCLVIKGKKNIKLTNGKLLVKEHAQTAIDCINSNGVINGLIIEGAGNFPPLYSTTGRGEKGEANAGYFNEALYNSGQPRNNSVNTSGYTGGNYGANGFPQWGGGNATTWGVWNGGYIFNIGDGIYLKNSDFKVEACDIYGFNGSPVCIVEGSVTLERNKLHDCYTAGFWAKSYGDGAGKIINSVEISNNHIYNMGHPDSKRTDTNVDPGYGVSTSNKSASTAGVRSYKVYGNSFYNCKRKAIDAHHSYFADVYGNRIESCGYGVFITINSYGATPKFTNVHDNFIRDIYMSVSTKGVGVDVTSSSTENGGFEGVININSNYLEDIGVPKSIFATNPSSATGFGITVNGIECANVGNNTIITTENCVTQCGIMDGSTGSVVNPRSVITGNYIKGKMQYGIFTRKDQYVTSHAKLYNAGITANNLVDIKVRDDQTTAIGINSYIYCKVQGNTVVQNTGVTPYANVNVVPSGVYSFDVNIATRAISDISQPIEGTLAISDIVVSIVNNSTLQIALPSLYKISGIQTNEKSTPRTATNYGLIYASGGSYSNLIKLGFASITNGVATAVNVADITAGVLRVFVTVPEIRIGV